MSWLFFALLAPAVTATVNFLDKFIIKGHQVDHRCMPVFAAIASITFGALLWGRGGFTMPRSMPDYAVISAGILSFAASILYFKVINSVAVSKILILFQLTPMIVLGLSALFLGETLRSRQFIGFLLIILASIGLSWQGKGGTKQTGIPLASFVLIIVVDLLYSASNVLQKYATLHSTVSNVFAFQSLGMGIGASILYLMSVEVRQGFKFTLRTLGKWPLVLIFLNEGIFNFGRFLSIVATSMHSVSIVNVVGSTQAFFGIFYGFILNKLAPGIFGENTSRIALVREVIFAALMFAGVYFVY